MVSRRHLLKLSVLGTASFAAPQAYSMSNISMTHNTGNPIGSTSPKDLSDNTRNLDYLCLGPNHTYLDRKGVPRKSWKGMEDGFNADQIARQSQFAAFMGSSGYEAPVAYAPELILCRATQIVAYLGNDYRVKSEYLPLTTTDWVSDEAKLKLIGDDSLRQDMANALDPHKGTGMAGYRHPALDSIQSTAYAKLGLMYVTPQDFDPSVGYGVTDAGAAVQKALNYLASIGGGELVYPPGQYKHITTPKLPVNLPNLLRISAFGATLVAVEGGRFFDVDKRVDGDTCQNIKIQGGFYDFTAMTGRNHVLLGTYVDGSMQIRVNFKNISFEHIRGLGPDPDPSLKNHIICAYLQCAHPSSREPVGGYVDDISLYDVKLTGGNAGYLIIGNALDSINAPNISMSTVRVVDSEHKLTVPPKDFFSSSNLHIGLDAIVKSVVVDNFYGENPGDNGIELNNVRTATLRHGRIKNPNNIGYYIDNKNPDFDSSTQIITYDTCVGDQAGYGDRAFQVGPYKSVGSSARGRLGQINYRDCGANFTFKGPSAGGFCVNGGLSGECFYDSINIENFKVSVIVDEELTSNRFPAMFTFRSSGSPKIDVVGLVFKYVGGIKQNGLVYRPRVVNLFGPDVTLCISGIRGVFDVSGVVDVFRTISLESGKANISASNNEVISNIPTSLLYVTPEDAFDDTHTAVISDSNWSRAGGPVVAGPTSVRKFVRVKDTRVVSPPGLVTLKPSASPQTITNLVGYQQQVFVSGGGVSSIELDVGTGVFMPTGVSTGSFMLSVGHSVRIVHTSAPTVRVAHLGT